MDRMALLPSLGRQAFYWSRLLAGVHGFNSDDIVRAGYAPERFQKDNSLIIVPKLFLSSARVLESMEKEAVSVHARSSGVHTIGARVSVVRNLQFVPLTAGGNLQNLIGGIAKRNRHIATPSVSLAFCLMLAAKEQEEQAENEDFRKRVNLYQIMSGEGKTVSRAGILLQEPKGLFPLPLYQPKKGATAKCLVWEEKWSPSNPLSPTDSAVFQAAQQALTVP